ncbi:MAG: bifunctional DNA-formamidopyrimidine glycosylase/DNA-(apurinic or apyrimidinic site) lyase [Solobacterium sp.]|jgi:formamidopyrimidine-DNA glycosylase|nr:bifunctional DNA-formamidopyrimidine glycosylase/DNA-(apurinic or apyrimidinic site) lyase [Solobacterium sp.]MCH4047853.1 bifunctional DNA-formamidopyrimidine glycosylase/DNA-(apurinic or apyrimidinic site) lyase [Solobacterium sp.]MCH4075561.1 bifunctional DNA-formamidopyrimidine glycosylase/DNA-(apurinic or apyrimidinic site) lyase [Solobacterium sp.]MCI1313243.1 bifunctional DNA-formamidopyrimidine glycosylase/DNA-(apurinic or apyrimidinic site) lyase [Solobacterium sp.]MCI1346013.1 bifu
MPELPEVETVVRTLEKQIKDEEILAVHVRYPKMIEDDVDTFEKTLAHEHFRRFERRGKYLIFRMDHVTLVAHLRMEGRFYLQKDDDALNRHMHVIFQLKDHRQLRYQDTRKFGRMKLFPLDYDFTHFKNLGPEPLSDAFNADYIHAYRSGRSEPLKSLLLDQCFTAGIGNIYADEILAACGLRPGRSCRRITRKDEEHIASKTKRILQAAIKAGGTTIRTYTSSLGVKGTYQSACTVHSQKVCARCGSEIHVKTIGGRSSYYCPHCQK